jgi:hypothetical protein
MAFHQPARQPAQQRVFHAAAEDESHLSPQPPASAIDESQTWVLFAPETDADTTTSYLTETHRSESTPGRSQLSDLGSLNTLAPSEHTASEPQSVSLGAADDLEDEDEDDEEDDAELDSLDSHLPGFRSTPNYYNNNNAQGLAPIVPAHDGLGSFRFDREGMGSDIQNRLYAFEQYNPRRVKRRRESLERAQLELEQEQEQEQEIDKMRRIEAWRLEHSRYLLDEIQKETRRRRRSAASSAHGRPVVGKEEEYTAAGEGQAAILDAVDENDAWHDEHASELGESESLWGRITRTVIHEMLGFDDKVLSILFGEALPDEEDLSATPRASALLRESRAEATGTNPNGQSWQLKILERIARELGMLVHQMSEHPGAFSSYNRMQQMPIPYAGLPSIPEAVNDATQAAVSARVASVTTIPEFKPTITAETRRIDVPNARAAAGSTPAGSHVQGDKTNNSAAFTQEEWEQDLDVKLVFRYLRSRFTSRSNSTGSVGSTAHLATLSNADAAAKAARVRQHHPLMSKARPAERRSFKAATPSSPVMYRRASSCASQSTRRSLRRSSCSSRHYWDIGAGSVGTGSMIAATGPTGSWGEI